LADPLIPVIREQLFQPVPGPVAALGEVVAERFGDAMSAVLFYGSCLRKDDPLDGLVDLYVIVSDYRAAYPGLRARLLAGVLPPTVSYLEAPTDAGPVRAKYAVLSERDFLKGTSRRWFHPYLWGRFAQPCRAWRVRDDEVADRLTRGIASAVRTLLGATRPLLGTTDPEEGWSRALALSYATELRPESGDRARTLVEADADYYARTWTAASEAMEADAPRRPDGTIPGQRRARLVWAVRRRTGKLMSVMRWLKALTTFEGGIDYAVWKLERHSGVRVTVPDRVRRRPWLYVWPELIRLYRSGVLR
jgi:hypothetical protein